MILAVITAVTAHCGVSGAVIPVNTAKLWAQASERWSYSATVNINDEHVLHRARPEILGAQNEPDSNGTAYLEGTNLDINQRWKDFAPSLYDFPLVRLGGSTTEAYSLIRNVGKFSTRRGSETVSPYHEYKVTPAARMGPVEFIKWIREINPDFTYLVNLSMTSATPEENAQFAAFLTHGATQSRWGAMRASLGFAAPIKVFAFELGNEIDWNWEAQGWTFNTNVLDWYTQTAAAHIAAIEAICPEAVFMGCGKTAPWEDGIGGASVKLWTDGVLQAIGHKLKYLSAHPYYDGMPIAYMDAGFDVMTNSIETILGADSGVELVMTEHARYGGGPGDTTGTMINLFAALSAAQFLNRLQARSNVGGATFHAMANVQTSIWSLSYLWDEIWYESVVGRMYHAYAKGMGDRVMESAIDAGGAAYANPASSDCRLTVTASAEGAHTLKLILVNGMENNGVNLSFNFQNTYKLVEETVFTAPNLSSFVYDDSSRNIASIVTTAKNEENFGAYHMPNKSLVVLVLETEQRLPALDEPLYEITQDGLTVNINPSDYDADGGNITVIAAYYGAGGRLVGTETREVDAGLTTLQRLGGFTIPAQIGAEGKLFLWGGGLRPLTDAVRIE
jgi:alpha-L-arabinofuranosidase